MDRRIGRSEQPGEDAHGGGQRQSVPAGQTGEPDEVAQTAV